jgi:hypothetical protein
LDHSYKAMKYFLFIVPFAVLISCTSHLGISQIDFKADACFGECPIFDMKISKDGPAKYDAKLYNEHQGQFFATIKQSQLDSLVMLIEKARFFSLKDKYSTCSTDHSTYYLTVN